MDFGRIDATRPHSLRTPKVSAAPPDEAYEGPVMFKLPADADVCEIHGQRLGVYGCTTCNVSLGHARKRSLRGHAGFDPT